MTGESVQQQLRLGRDCGRGRIALQDYGTSVGKLYAIFAISAVRLPDSHTERMQMVAHSVGQTVLFREDRGRTLVWLTMQGTPSISARNNIAWEFMVKYADWARDYREPEPAQQPEPEAQTEAKVLLFSSTPSTTGGSSKQRRFERRVKERRTKK